MDLAADTYAYPAWFNSMSAFVPPWALDGGTAKLVERLQRSGGAPPHPPGHADAERRMGQRMAGDPGPESVLISVVQNPALLQYQGKTLAEVAKQRKADPIETLLDLLVEDRRTRTSRCSGCRSGTSRWRSSSRGSRSRTTPRAPSPDGPLGKEHPHPRAYGTFPRIIRKYVREEQRLTLEEAIRKFTSLPAGRMRLADRGVLKAGMWADVVVFDPDSVRDKATFAEPNQLAVGMAWVLVNGVPVIADGKATGALPGRVLRGPGCTR